MKTIVVTNYSQAAKLFKGYEEVYKKNHSTHELSVISLLELSHGWNIGAGRIVIESNLGSDLFSELQKYMPCEDGWTTVTEIIDSGYGNGPAARNISPPICPRC